MRGANLQCVNNHYAKFKCIGMNTVGVTDKHVGWKKCLSLTPIKVREKIRNVHKIRGAHFQCMNNYYTKFECKGNNTIGVTDFTN